MDDTMYCPVDGEPLTEHELGKACKGKGKGNSKGLYCILDGILIQGHPQCNGCKIFFGDNHLEREPTEDSFLCASCFKR